ncbi:MAG: lipoyl(octanoyl) transferase LipB [Gammaproteobacteria bacterium]|nr:lipoyl(octanoyl) transferase LipB [Gammaproteobacteria bacterium]
MPVKDLLPLTVRDLGTTEYSPVLRQMQHFTRQRHATSRDEVWFVEHTPVFTLGMNADPTNILDSQNIPVITTDRGGQVTYHGPGQILMYPLLDLQRRRLGVKTLVNLLEQTVISVLADYGICAGRRDRAPGVYVNAAKIAALGLRIRRGRCYHGVAFNITMDLTPFHCIHPCGFENLRVTQLRDLVPDNTPPLSQVKQGLLQHFTRLLSYNPHLCTDTLVY